MRSIHFITCISAISLLASCISDNKEMHASTADTGHLAAATGKPTAAATVELPGLKDLKNSNLIDLKANDRMQFSDTLFKVKAGEKVTLRLINIGNMPKESMGHNFTLLTKGTDFRNYATKAMEARDTEYQPADLKSAVIAHTKLVGPKESDTITFIIPDKGVYDFLCTFPGHYGTMRGKIVAE